jgi:hypothetical protein
MLEVRYAKSVGNVSDSFHRLQAQAVVRNLLDDAGDALQALRQEVLGARRFAPPARKTDE